MPPSRRAETTPVVSTAAAYTPGKSNRWNCSLVNHDEFQKQEKRKGRSFQNKRKSKPKNLFCLALKKGLSESCSAEAENVSADQFAAHRNTCGHSIFEPGTSSPFHFGCAVKANQASCCHFLGGFLRLSFTSDKYSHLFCE